MVDIHISGLTSELLEYARTGMPEHVAMISIMDHKRDCVNRYPTPRVIRLCFDDAVETSFWQNLITSEQAVAIRDFVLFYMDSVELLIVHCTEGVSRSSAVAAAILDGLNMDSGWIWNSVIYRPNPLVYKLVLNAFQDSASCK